MSPHRHRTKSRVLGALTLSLTFALTSISGFAVASPSDDADALPDVDAPVVVVDDTPAAVDVDAALPDTEPAPVADDPAEEAPPAPAIPDPALADAPVPFDAPDPADPDPPLVEIGSLSEPTFDDDAFKYTIPIDTRVTYLVTVGSDPEESMSAGTYGALRILGCGCLFRALLAVEDRDGLGPPPQCVERLGLVDSSTPIPGLVGRKRAKNWCTTRPGWRQFRVRACGKPTGASMGLRQDPVCGR